MSITHVSIKLLLHINVKIEKWFQWNFHFINLSSVINVYFCFTDNQSWHFRKVTNIATRGKLLCFYFIFSFPWWKKFLFFFNEKSFVEGFFFSLFMICVEMFGFTFEIYGFVIGTNFFFLWNIQSFSTVSKIKIEMIIFIAGKENQLFETTWKIFMEKFLKSCKRLAIN